MSQSAAKGRNTTTATAQMQNLNIRTHTQTVKYYVKLWHWATCIYHWVRYHFNPIWTHFSPLLSSALKLPNELHSVTFQVPTWSRQRGKYLILNWLLDWMFFLFSLWLKTLIFFKVFICYCFPLPALFSFHLHIVFS